MAVASLLWIIVLLLISGVGILFWATHKQKLNTFIFGIALILLSIAILSIAFYKDVADFIQEALHRNHL